jgi:GT2 family glycosyltransferase
VLGLQENYGYCEGNNKAIKYISTKKHYKYFIILNNDTIVPENQINQLIEFMDKHKDVGITSPLVINEANHSLLDNAGLSFNLFTGVSISIGHGKEIKSLKENIKPYSISGTCFVVRTRLLTEIGGYLFDPFFFCYYEENDLCVRIRKTNYKIKVLRDSFIFHKGSVSAKKLSGFSEYQLIRNRFLIIKKHSSYLQKMIFLIVNLFLYFPYHCLVLARNRSFSNIKYFLKGYASGIRCFFGDKLANYDHL